MLSDPSCIHQGACTATQGSVTLLPLLCRDQQAAHRLCWESKEVRLGEKLIIHTTVCNALFQTAQTSGFVV